MELFIIKTVPLFQELNARLSELIESMDAQACDTKTQFPNWTVKDILAHLLDTAVRRLSLQRDKYQSSRKVDINSYQDLVRYITDLTDRWSDSFANVSPQILTELIEKYQNELAVFFSSLDPFGKAHFPVNWAGETASLNQNRRR